MRPRPACAGWRHGRGIASTPRRPRIRRKNHPLHQKMETGHGYGVKTSQDAASIPNRPSRRPPCSRRPSACRAFLAENSGTWHPWRRRAPFGVRCGPSYILTPLYQCPANRLVSFLRLESPYLRTQARPCRGPVRFRTGHRSGRSSTPIRRPCGWLPRAAMPVVWPFMSGRVGRRRRLSCAAVQGALAAMRRVGSVATGVSQHGGGPGSACASPAQRCAALASISRFLGNLSKGCLLASCKALARTGPVNSKFCAAGTTARSRRSSSREVEGSFAPRAPRRIHLRVGPFGSSYAPPKDL